MNFEEHINETPHYHGDYFQFGETVFRQPIVFGNDVVNALPEKTWQDLTLDDFQAAIASGASLILLGTGAKQHFISPQIIAQLSAQGVGLECMNSAAACRTLMLLQAEGRHVWAWLFL